MTFPLTPDAALLARCRSALAKHRRRARADRQRLDYDLAALLALATAARTCAYCGCLLHAGILAFDHAAPTGRTADYRLANVVCCCRTCNEAKGVLSAAEFKQLVAL